MTLAWAFGRLARADTLHTPVDVRATSRRIGTTPRRRRLVSINSVLQVGLSAQGNAGRVYGVICSGFSGQIDFVVGALH